MRSCLDFFVTGFPRSGTSLLCKLLNRQDDFVVVSEPREIFPAISDADRAYISTYYADLRKDIIRGTPIENKIINGDIIEDTAITDTRSFYVAGVKSDEFMLGTKNTIGYLSRLDCLKEKMPQSRIIACIRHPVQTIASWKVSFPHLQNADVAKFPIGHPKDAFLSADDRSALEAIEAAVNLPEKRALLWAYFAGILLRHRADIMIIRYEDLIADAAPVLADIDRYLGAVTNSDVAVEKGLSLSDKSAVLSPEDTDAINRICQSNAEKLGY